MNLSEVIKAVEDGSKIGFKNGQFKAIREYNAECIEITLDGMETDIFPLDGWEEVKPPRQWSEKELMLFKLLPKNINWIAKDKVGDDIWGFNNKPEFDKREDWVAASESFGVSISELFDFLTITFDESPIYISDLKGE